MNLVAGDKPRLVEEAEDAVEEVEEARVVVAGGSVEEVPRGAEADLQEVVVVVVVEGVLEVEEDSSAFLRNSLQGNNLL